MRRTWLYLVAIFLIAAAVIASVIAVKNFMEHKDIPVQTSQTAITKPVKACRIFTLPDAKKLLGESAKGGTNPVYTSSADLDVSTCSYSQGQGTSAAVSSLRSATLLVREPKSASGSSSNRNQFGPLKPQDSQDVAGYGDSAYWDTEHGQLNILKNDKWYILSFGPVTPANRTLDQTRQLADLLIIRM